MAKGYPISFSELKAKVGIDDVAYSLGYKLDRKAGVGRYFELVLGDYANPTDKIVVSNTPDKSRQFYFRRDGSKGDVISFIRENLNAMNVEGHNEWTRVANALAKYANCHIDARYAENNGRHTSENESRTFDPSRYIVTSARTPSLHWILKKRGFTPDTVAAMADKIVLIRDTRNTKFDGYNVGFPYTRPDTDALSGYEIRGGNGFKSKASGTDSSASAWIVDFPKGNPQASRDVYFFESSFDAMSFYQLNKVRLNGQPFSLVSMGGAFNPALTELIMKRYPAAKAWDCFDNDPAGQIYSANLVKAIDKVDFSIEQKDGITTMTYDGRQIQCPKDQFDFRKTAVSLGMTYSSGHWKSPSNFKDWNDCLMGVPITPTLTPSKYKRDENLLNQRKASSLKM